MGASYKPSESALRGVLPPARLRLLKGSQLNQTLPLTAEQVFKPTGDTDTQTTGASAVVETAPTVCWLGLSSHGSAWWGHVLSVT